MPEQGRRHRERRLYVPPPLRHGNPALPSNLTEPRSSEMDENEPSSLSSTVSQNRDPDPAPVGGTSPLVESSSGSTAVSPTEALSDSDTGEDSPVGHDCDTPPTDGIPGVYPCLLLQTHC